jgi:Glycosyl transferase family 2
MLRSPRLPAAVEPVDIVMLSYNRLDYLVRTLDALFERTPEPFRLTVVDNASRSDVRTWLVANRSRFHRLILQPVNEHIAGFQRGIENTTSDPFLLAEPDLIVPDLRPSWLARLRDTLERHPDFGLLAVGLDTVNRPSVLGAETLEPGALVDGEIVEGNVGIWFQMIRRGALGVPYTKDSVACAAIRAAGYRVGWVPSIRALHLGWDDFERHPAHLARKNEIESPYPYYREVELIERPPSLEELALAAPVVAETRAAGVADAAVLELAWSEPVLGAALEEVVTVTAPSLRLPLEDGAAGAVVFVDPPQRALDEAVRLASSLVILVCDLEAVGGAGADELAPEGWSGVERPAIGSLPLELARAGDALQLMAGSHRYTTLEDRERWLELFAAGVFGEAERRLFVLRRDAPAPERVVGAERLPRWRPAPRGDERRPPSRAARLRYELGSRVPAPARRLLRRALGR